MGVQHSKVPGRPDVESENVVAGISKLELYQDAVVSARTPALDVVVLKAVKRTTGAFVELRCIRRACLQPEDQGIVEILKHMRAVPHVQRLEHVVDCPALPGWRVYEMQWTSSRSLLNELNEVAVLSENQVAEMSYDLLLALHALHAHGVAHLSVSPASIVLRDVRGRSKRDADADEAARFFTGYRPQAADEQQQQLARLASMRRRGSGAVLTGFETARSFSGSDARARVLAHAHRSEYLAPEVVKQGVCSAAADVYALGAVAFRALTGQTPPRRSQLAKLQRKGAGRKLPARVEIPGNAAWNTQISACACELVLRMLWHDAAGRISVADALQHDWFRMHDVTRPLQAAAERASSASTSAAERPSTSRRLLVVPPEASRDAAADLFSPNQRFPAKIRTTASIGRRAKAQSGESAPVPPSTASTCIPAGTSAGTCDMHSSASLAALGYTTSGSQSLQSGAATAAWTTSEAPNGCGAARRMHSGGPLATVDAQADAGLNDSANAAADGTKMRLGDCCHGWHTETEPTQTPTAGLTSALSDLTTVDSFSMHLPATPGGQFGKSGLGDSMLLCVEAQQTLPRPCEDVLPAEGRVRGVNVVFDAGRPAMEPSKGDSFARRGAVTWDGAASAAIDEDAFRRRSCSTDDSGRGAGLSASIDDGGRDLRSRGRPPSVNPCMPLSESMTKVPLYVASYANPMAKDGV